MKKEFMNVKEQEHSTFGEMMDPEHITLLCEGEYTYFTKYNIMKTYELMHDHLYSDKVTDEEDFFNMIMKINMTLVTIPKEVHDKIVAFALSEIGPLALNPSLVDPVELENVLPFTSSKEDGDEMLDHLKKHYDPIFQVVKKLEIFAVTELNPILWS